MRRKKKCFIDGETKDSHIYYIQTMKMNNNLDIIFFIYQLAILVIIWYFQLSFAQNKDQKELNLFEILTECLLLLYPDLSEWIVNKFAYWNENSI